MIIHPRNRFGQVRSFFTVLFLLLTAFEAKATVFTTVQFLEPGRSSLGFEPEFVLSSGAGFGGNLRYTTGLNDLSNLSFLIGTGSGPRQFRVGAVYTADFFPDTEEQPGIGIGLQGTWGRVTAQSVGGGVCTTGCSSATVSRLDIQLLPYLHNRFQNSGGDVEPFFSFPFGVSVRDGTVRASSAVAVGAFFYTSPRFQYSMEVNVGVNNAESTLSGGIVYPF